MKVVKLKKLEVNKGTKVFMFSDPHYYHLNLCSATTKFEGARKKSCRQFDTIEDMNDTIVNGINSTVGPDDILICMGDFAFNGVDNVTVFRNRINCKNLFIIVGNHDHHIVQNTNNVQELFNEVWDDITFLNIKYPHLNKSVNFVLSHYPIASWPNMNQGWYHVHGHVHLPKKKVLGRGKSLDVYIERNEYKPYDVLDIDKMLSVRPIKSLRLPKDHHEDNQSIIQRFLNLFS